MIDTGATTEEQLSLDECLEWIDQHLDATSLDSLLACAPKLLALSRNRKFLPDFIAAGLADPDSFQAGNPYGGDAILLGSGEGYFLRAVGWPPETQLQQAATGEPLHVYESVVGHSHNFSFLTTLYWGSGYETDLFEVDPSKIAGVVGEEVELRKRGRARLPANRVMLYRAHSDVHIQRPPREYSVSLNLVVSNPLDDVRDQYLFNVSTNRIIACLSPANDARIELVNLAKALGDVTMAPILDRIRETHPSRRVSEQAGLVSKSLHAHAGVEATSIP